MQGMHYVTRIFMSKRDEAQSLQLAFSLHRSGKFVEAAELYRKVIKWNPGEPNAPAFPRNHRGRERQFGRGGASDGPLGSRSDDKPSIHAKLRHRIVPA